MKQGILYEDKPWAGPVWDIEANNAARPWSGNAWGVGNLSNTCDSAAEHVTEGQSLSRRPQSHTRKCDTLARTVFRTVFPTVSEQGKLSETCRAIEQINFLCRGYELCPRLCSRLCPSEGYYREPGQARKINFLCRGYELCPGLCSRLCPQLCSRLCYQLISSV